MKTVIHKYIGNHKNIRIAGIVASFTLAILAIFTLIPIYIKSEVAEGTAGQVETPTLTMVVGHESANLDLIVNSSSGTFASTDSDNMAEFTVQTNNYTGYKLNINGKSDNDDNNKVLVNNNTGDTLSSITKAVDSNTFSNPDNTATLNKWGFITSRYNSTTSTYDYLLDGNYQPAPTKSGFMLDNISTAGTYNYTIGLGAKADYTVPSGLYANTYILTATANPVAYAINYYDTFNSTADKPVYTQADKTNTAATIKLSPSYTIPARSTYTFMGWCDTEPTNGTNDYFPVSVCNGNTYTSGDNYLLDPTIYNEDIKLYAYWKPTTFEEAYQKIAQQTGDSSILTKVTGNTSTGANLTAYQMQKMSKDICAATTINEVTQLVDNRKDGNVAHSYYVAKLKDGKCWMTQNLRLGTNIAATTGTLRLYPSDSNISSTTSYWDLTNKVADGMMPNATCVTSGCEDRHTRNTYYWDGNAYYCAPIADNDYVGCYYNWFSATAGSGTSSTTPVGSSSGYKDVSSSICPKNWYLPSGGGTPLSGSTSDRSNSDFNMLYDNYSSASEMLVASPTTTYDNMLGLYQPGFLLSGRYRNGPNSVSSDGFYWSRSAFSKGLAYYLYFRSSAVGPQTYSFKYEGYSIRCVAYSS